MDDQSDPNASADYTMEAIKRDAARYRFLRDCSTFSWDSLQLAWLTSADEVDRIIDEAMSQWASKA